MAAECTGTSQKGSSQQGLVSADIRRTRVKNKRSLENAFDEEKHLSRRYRWQPNDYEKTGLCEINAYTLS